MGLELNWSVPQTLTERGLEALLLAPLRAPNDPSRAARPRRAASAALGRFPSRPWITAPNCAPLAPSSSSASLMVPTAMAVVAADGIPFPLEASKRLSDVVCWRRNRKARHRFRHPTRQHDRHLLPLLAQLCTEIATIAVRQPDIKSCWIARTDLGLPIGRPRMRMSRRCGKGPT